MFRIGINLCSPFGQPETMNGWSNSWSISIHKNIEIEINRVHRQWILFETELTTLFTRDHWGFELRFGLFGYEIAVSLYDSRHRDIKWDGDG